MDYLKIAKISIGLAVFSAVMALISPFVCGKRNHNHSCSHNYSTESNHISNYNEKRNILEKLADANQDEILSNNERAKMYEMCGIADKPAGYVLTLEDFNKGIENYLNN